MKTHTLPFFAFGVRDSSPVWQEHDLDWDESILTLIDCHEILYRNPLFSWDVCYWFCDPRPFYLDPVKYLNSCKMERHHILCRKKIPHYPFLCNVMVPFQFEPVIVTCSPQIEIIELPSKTAVCTLVPEEKLGMVMCLKLWQVSISLKCFFFQRYCWVVLINCLLLYFSAPLPAHTEKCTDTLRKGPMALIYSPPSFLTFAWVIGQNYSDLSLELFYFLWSSLQDNFLLIGCPSYKLGLPQTNILIVG